MEYKINFPEKYLKPKLPMGKQWVAALRSGQYKQGINRLCSIINYSTLETCYCCLGVLSKLQGRLVKNEVGFVDTSEGHSPSYLTTDNPLYQILGIGGQLPYGVNVVYSISYDNRLFEQNHLAELNDTGFTFEEIANIIEQVWDCQ